MKERVCEFVVNELAPMSKEIDEKGEFPWEIISKLAEQGLLGLPFPQEYGGSGMDMICYCIALEELAKECRSTATISLAHAFTAFAIHLFGSHEQKKQYLAQMAKGKMLGAFGITERIGGSDIASLQTEARVKGNEYVINGEKSYITNSGQAELYIILASADKTKDSKNLTAFMIEKGTEGLSFGNPEDLISMRGISIGDIHLKNCVVPKENIIGNEGDGIKIVLSCIDRGRIATSAIGVGLAQGALNSSIEYSKKRSQFGRALSEFQATQFSIADMATQIEAARL
ncbi:acyl-CoA dehydrogenase family protein, partial [Candidatus Pacearchaeota archaeon]|nr:acyl-CoA dehydrogenase family protein [Candidatus Pacearchaeota archaeon]